MAGIKGSKREPWEVVCPCGKTFLTACYNVHLCPECRKERTKERKRQWRQSEKGKAYDRRERRKMYEKHKEKELERRKRYHAEHREQDLQRKREWNAKNAERCRRYAKLKFRQDQGDIAAKLELAKLTGKALYCERMRVTAMSLPCGKRDECWNGKPCPRTIELGLTPPRRRELFDFGKLF